MKLVFNGIGTVLIVIGTILWLPAPFITFKKGERTIPMMALIGMIGLSIFAIIDFISQF